MLLQNVVPTTWQKNAYSMKRETHGKINSFEASKEKTQIRSGYLTNHPALQQIHRHKPSHGVIKTLATSKRKGKPQKFSEYDKLQIRGSNTS